MKDRYVCWIVVAGYFMGCLLGLLLSVGVPVVCAEFNASDDRSIVFYGILEVLPDVLPALACLVMVGFLGFYVWSKFQ